MDLAGTVVVGTACNMNKVLSTLVLCRAVICVNYVVSNMWLTCIITLFVIELNEVSEFLMEHVIVFLAFR